MKIINKTIQEYSNGKNVISLHISDFYFKDNMLDVHILAKISKYIIEEFEIPPSWCGVKLTKNQVLEIIKKEYPEECKHITVNLLQPAVSPKPYIFTKEKEIQGLVRRNIDIISENIIMVHKGEKYYEARIQGVERLSAEIIKIFEEYKKLS